MKTNDVLKVSVLFNNELIPCGTWEMQSVTRCLACILLAWVIGLLNRERRVARCLA